MTIPPSPRSPLRRAAAVTTASAAALGAVVASTPTASADELPWGINGTYSAVSNGEWSKTNDKFENQANVFDTWIISTTCRTVIDCEGTVQSGFGWTARIWTASGIWNVSREIPDWMPCPVGPPGPATQVFTFWRAADDGWQDPRSEILVGNDKTTGDSGNCGVNQSKVIFMPFKLTPI